MRGVSGMVCLAAGLLAVAACASAPIQKAAGPAFDSEGRFIVPAGTDSWPTVGVTVAMQYEGDVGGKTINSVRLDPASYETFVKTGEYPVGAMLELEIRRIQSGDELAREGSFQGAVATHSIHIKDEKAGPGTWTFYGYPPGQTLGQPIARTANCYSCHEEHGKTDTTFTQFYPAMMEAQAKAMAHP